MNGANPNAVASAVGSAVMLRVIQARQVVLALTLAFLFGLGNIFAQQVPSVPSGGKDFREDRILVKPKAEANLNALMLLHNTKSNRVVRSYPRIGNLQVIKLPPGAKAQKALAAYQQSGLVKYAEPDYIVHGLLAPNDPYYTNGSQWPLSNSGQSGGTAGADIHATEGWITQNDASSVIIAVIDSGIRYTHEDLAANMWVNPSEVPGNGLDDDGDGYVDDVYGINAITGSGDPVADHGHGTHVAGILGAVGNNGVGIAGVAWRVKIMACKFLDPQLEGTMSDAIECIDYARSKGAKIINASWGKTVYNSSALYDAINSARQAGILFVAACGNSANDNDTTGTIYPASFDLDNIISVAATTRNDQLAWFSSYGHTTVDLGAPGEIIVSCWNGNDSHYTFESGTSMAAPHVAGACALVWARYPNESYLQIKNRVLAGTDPIAALTGKCVTGGRLNLQKALGPALPALAVRSYANGQFQLRVYGDPNTTFTVQRSVDLTNWAALYVGRTSSGGTLDYTDKDAGGTGKRFYRAMVGQ